MKKRVIFVCIALILFLTGIDTSKAISWAKGNDTAEEICNSLQFMKTDQGTPITEDTQITREEFAQVLLNFSPYKGEAAAVSKSHYRDVPARYWAARYIETAASEGWMKGRLDGTFRPKRKITVQEAAYGVLKILGYEDGDFTGTLSTGVMKLYRKKALNRNISLTQNKYLTGSACRNLLYNALMAQTKDGKNYAELLGCTVLPDGELDYSKIIRGTLAGPRIVKAKWKSTLPFSSAKAVYYKNDKQCLEADIKENDVIYYSKSKKSVWAYDYKISGSLDEIKTEEGKSTPASITLAGSEDVYRLGTSEAVTHFSISGDITAGDLITLLLDKDGKTVVGAQRMTDGKSSTTGVIIKLFSKNKVVNNGRKENVNYLTMVNTLGQELSLKYDGSKYDYYVGQPVTLNCTGTVPSIIEITKADYEKISGIVDDNGSIFNGASFGNNCSILDIKGGAYKQVNTDRIANIRLKMGDVLYMSKNSTGQISELILNNITGDLDSYGIISSMDYTQETLPKVYYDINGKSGEFNLNTIEANIMVDTPVKFEMEDGEILKASSLFSLGEIKYNSKGEVMADNSLYKLSDDLVVYRKIFDTASQKYRYKCIPFSNMGDTADCIMTGWYDKRVEDGGRIRVIIVTKK